MTSITSIAGLLLLASTPAIVSSFVCTHTVLHASNTGTIFSSPGFPFGYPNHLDCSWTLQAPPGQQVEIVFIDILTETCCDIIELRDGNSSDAGLLATYRGNATESIYASSFGSLYIRFRSDDSYVYYGFFAQYRIATVKTDCGAQLIVNEANNSLASPGWPFEYDNNLQCRWTLKAPKGKCVSLIFVSMETESCCDYILVRYGDTMNSEMQELGGKIGPDVMPRFVSTSETLQVVFRSDSTEKLKGFYAIYSAASPEECEKPLPPTKKEKCGRRLHLPRRGHQSFTTPRYPSVHANDLKCAWILIAPQNLRVILWFTSINTEECCDFIKIRDGEFNNSRKLGVLSGNENKFIPYVSSKNILRVEFESDMTNTKRGFRAVFETFQDSSKESCGGNLRALIGVRQYISSPNWPKSPSSTQCVWKISAPPGMIVLFNVIGFHTDRYRDELLFYDGNSLSSPLLGVMNGRKMRTRFVSSSSTLLLVFNSDFTTREGGFRGLYKAIMSRDTSPQPSFDEETTAPNGD